jgi:peptide chain release factor 2
VGRHSRQARRRLWLRSWTWPSKTSRKDWGNSGSFFDLEGRKKKIAELEKLSSQPGFWNDNQKAQLVLKEISQLKRWSERWEELSQKTEDIVLLNSMAQEEDDHQADQEVAAGLDQLKREVDDFEFQAVLSGEDDAKNAILAIHSGAGGTESQDWAQMLLRMYTRWAERRGY